MRPKGSSSCVGSKSGWKAGNLNVTFGLESCGDSDAIASGAGRWRSGRRKFVTPWRLRW